MAVVQTETHYFIEQKWVKKDDWFSLTMIDISKLEDARSEKAEWENHAKLTGNAGIFEYRIVKVTTLTTMEVVE